MYLPLQNDAGNLGADGRRILFTTFVKSRIACDRGCDRGSFLITDTYYDDGEKLLYALFNSERFSLVLKCGK